MGFRVSGCRNEVLQEFGVRTWPGAHRSELMMRFIGGSGRFQASGSGRVKQVRSRAFHLEVSWILH